MLYKHNITNIYTQNLSNRKRPLFNLHPRDTYKHSDQFHIHTHFDYLLNLKSIYIYITLTNHHHDQRGKTT